MKVGYARVSSVGQNLAVQLDKLDAAGCTKVYQEKESARTAARPQLQACLDFVRDAADTLVVTKLDRLARSLTDLVSITHRLRAKGVALQVLDQAIDTTTPEGTFTFHILGAVAEFENDLRRARQREGIDAALRRGQRCGRRPTLTPAQAVLMQEARRQGVLIKDLMAQYHLSKKAIYRYLNHVQPARSLAAQAAD